MEKFFRLYIEILPKLVLTVIENYAKFPTMCCRNSRTGV